MILTVNAIGIFLILAIYVYSLVRTYLIYRRVKRIIEDFLTSSDSNTPSQFAQLIDTISRAAGHAIALEIKTTLMGKASAESRQLAAMQGDVVTDAAANTPGISALLAASPSLGKRLRRNPGLIDLAMQFLPGLLGKAGTPSGSVGRSDNHEVKFHL